MVMELLVKVVWARAVTNVILVVFVLVVTLLVPLLHQIQWIVHVLLDIQLSETIASKTLIVYWIHGVHGLPVYSSVVKKRLHEQEQSELNNQDMVQVALIRQNLQVAIIQSVLQLTAHYLHGWTNHAVKA